MIEYDVVGGYDCPCVVLCAHAQIIAEVWDAWAGGIRVGMNREGAVVRPT